MGNKKLLIVEDDQYFREALIATLERTYTILEAPNGKSAKEILAATDVDLVLTDIQMPGLTGLELLAWAKIEKPNLPFVLMTGFSMLLETKSAFEIGAQGFIAKPFKQADLLTTLASVLNPMLEAKYEVSEAKAQYFKVSIEEFVARPKIDFDVYIKLSEDKVVKIAHKGQEIPRNKVEYYKEKGLKHLHIMKEDYAKLVEFNLNLASIIVDRDDISIEKKANFLKYTGEVILEKTFMEGLDKKGFNEAKMFLELSISTLISSKKYFDVLSMLNTHSDHLYAHSLGVSLYAVMIAKLTGYESTTSLFKLSMAGLFHDIGNKEIDRTLLEKPRHLMSKEDRQQIESHCLRGQEILNSLPGTPSDVVQLVAEHHEDLDGFGYPFRKSKHDQHPMSKVIQCADLFVEQSLNSPQTLGKPPLDAIIYMKKIYGSRIDPDCLTALQKIFAAAS